MRFGLGHDTDLAGEGTLLPEIEMHVLRNRDYRESLEQPANVGGLRSYSMKKIRIQALSLVSGGFRNNLVKTDGRRDQWLITSGFCQMRGLCTRACRHDVCRDCPGGHLDK
jgi:hypothetical protein